MDTYARRYKLPRVGVSARPDGSLAYRPKVALSDSEDSSERFSQSISRHSDTADIGDIRVGERNNLCVK